MKAPHAPSRWLQSASPGRWRLFAVLLLAAMFAQLLSAVTQLSATIDEGFHITSGYEYLRTGQMRLLDEHVPLAKALFAWPLLFVPDLLPLEQAAGWVEGDLIAVAEEMVLAYQPIDRIVVACRVPVALLTVLLAATVYRLAADWFGPAGGVLALLLLSFDPNVLAHGSLATTDMGAVAFILWAVWAFTLYLRRPSVGRWCLAALLLGLAQGAKLTASLLLPLLGLLALVDASVKARNRRLQALLRRVLSYSGMVVVAGLVLWALYLFEVRTLPGLADGALPLPAASHIERWLRLRANMVYGRESFLLGQNRMHGWWQYFPVTFALKTPLPTLLLTVLTIGALALGRRRGLREELALGLLPVAYGGLSLASTINIGYRHLLPVLPFLSVSAGRLAAIGPRWEPGRKGHAAILRLSLSLLFVWLCLETLLLSPHYLAYFNAIAGGPDEGYRFLADSNTDWGQALNALAGYQRRNDLGPVRLSLFTFLDPATYGVRYEPIAPMRGAPPVLPRRFNPEPGVYAISATTLDGVPLPLPSTYDWFRHRSPMARVGHVMFIYDVEAREGSEWVAQCTVPVAPLTPKAVADGFGSETLRQIHFDCEQGWVFPGGGMSAGWYARATPDIDGLRWPRPSDRLEWWPTWAQDLIPEGMRLSYVQPTPGDLPAFAVWEWAGTSIAPPAVVEEVGLDETLVFLGYESQETAEPGAELDVLTYWRVLVRPSRPLSLMLHLTDRNGIPIAVGDGLGVPVDQWQVGDIIVQRHTLSVPADTPPGVYQVRTGAYWLDNMTRLIAAGGTEIQLGALDIR